MCQDISRAVWVDAKREDILDVPYFHVVFTLPAELNSLIYRNQEELYGLLFKSASDTLSEMLYDSRYLGGQPGFLCVLHTWGQELNYHPHLHCIVTGCAYSPLGNCVTGKEDYLLPVRALSKKFRGKYLDGLKRSYEGGHLRCAGCEAEGSVQFQALLDACYGKKWCPYIKDGFHDTSAVLEYLGRYTHRIAISNRRILGIEGEDVVFRAKDYRKKGAEKTVRLDGVEFVRRFLMHVLPPGFRKIRAYGLMSSRCHAKLEACRKQLGCQKQKSRLKGKSMSEVLWILYQTDICRCQECASGKLEQRKIKSFHSRDRPCNGR